MINEGKEQTKIAECTSPGQISKCYKNNKWNEIHKKHKKSRFFFVLWRFHNIFRKRLECEKRLFGKSG